MSTQELVDNYLTRKGYSDTDDELDLDLFLDPLDDPMDLIRGTLSLPPTPHESPLKEHFNRLRGSPVKSVRPLRRSPVKNLNYVTTPRKGRVKLDDYEDFLIDNLDDLITHKTLEQNYVPSSREFEKYSTLLKSSTDKLMRQLQGEKAKNRQLEARLAAVESDNFRASVTQSDYNLLKKEYAALEAKNAKLEAELALEQKLKRDNLLLREKLAKYKKLYDELRSGQAPTVAWPKSLDSSSQSAEKVSVGVQVGSSSVSEGSDQREESRSSRTSAASVPGERSKDSSSEVQFESLVAILQQAFKMGQGEKAKSERAAPMEHEAPENKEAKSVTRSESGPDASETPQRQIFPAEYGQQLAELAASVGRIGQEMKCVNATLREAPGVSGAHTGKRPCSACSSVASKSRPVSESTQEPPPEPTRALMGQYSWNRTV